GRSVEGSGARGGTGCAARENGLGGLVGACLSMRTVELPPGQGHSVFGVEHDQAEMLLSVGHLARRSGLTTKALRHYDRIGLLLPASSIAVLATGAIAPIRCRRPGWSTCCAPWTCRSTRCAPPSRRGTAATVPRSCVSSGAPAAPRCPRDAAARRPAQDRPSHCGRNRRDHD